MKTIEFVILAATDPEQPILMACQHEGCGETMTGIEAELHARKAHGGDAMRVWKSTATYEQHTRLAVLHKTGETR